MDELFDDEYEWTVLEEMHGENFGYHPVGLLSNAAQREESRFQQLLSRLQRHDPTLTQIAYDRIEEAIPRHYGQRLGQALLGNPYIVDVEIPSEHCFLDRLESYGEEEESRDIVATKYSTDPIMPLLQYIGDSTTALQCLSILGETGHAAAFLKAAGRNTNIQRLELLSQTLQSEDTIAALVHMLIGSKLDLFSVGSTRTCPVSSIKYLCIPLTDNEQVVHALECNTSVETLELQINFDLPQPASGVVFRRLAKALDSISSPPIRELILVSQQPDIPLTHTILSSFWMYIRSTTNLRKLSLTHAFDDASVEYLMDGLMESPSLTALSLVACEFADSSMKLLHDTLKKHRTAPGMDPTIFNCVGLCELRLVDLIEFPATFDAPSYNGKVMTEMIIGWRKSLKKVVCGGDMLERQHEFWKALNHNASQICLTEFCCDWIDITCFVPFVKCLPKVTTLRNLTCILLVEKKDRESTHPVLLKALRSNGSLQTVSFVSGDAEAGSRLSDSHENFGSPSVRKRVRGEDSFNEAERRYIKAIWERNRCLSTNCTTAVTHQATTTTQGHVDFKTKDTAAQKKIETCVLPTLFSAAQQAPAVAPKAMFAKLLTMDCTVADKKRCRLTQHSSRSSP